MGLGSLLAELLFELLAGLPEVVLRLFLLLLEIILLLLPLAPCLLLRNGLGP